MQQVLKDLINNLQRLNDDKLMALKTSYPFLFSSSYDDAFWIQKSNDSLEIMLTDEVSKAFNHNEVWKEDVVNLFKHLSIIIKF